MTKPTVRCDIEVYRNYLLIGFQNAETGNVRQFEAVGEDGKLSPEDAETIRDIFIRYRVVTFNGNHYDLPMITAALKGCTCIELKTISDQIIKNNLKPWNLGIETMRADHVDLFELVPGGVTPSLKICGGRLHCPKMQELPIHEAASIGPEDRVQLRTYNVNDLELTGLLQDFLAPQIELREKMSEVYGIDLRSKSDAQIAEAVIASEVGKSIGSDIRRPEVEAGTTFFYEPPAFLAFKSQELRDLMDLIRRVEFMVPGGGSVQLPSELAKRVIRIGRGDYRLGIGGLHSSEKTASHFSDDEYVIVDRDVTSYYPMIILNNALAPAHMGAAFSRVYRKIVDQRVAAKRAGDKVSADSLKIVANGSFGKFGSKWSKLYSPHLMIQTTITGQLSLLMLIEALEETGFQVLSANTDGIAIKCPRDRRAMMEEVMVGWEGQTGFATEETEYASLHSRDVNSYVALKPDGGTKTKGAFAPPGLTKNPANVVSTEAAIAFLRDGVPVEETVMACDDIRQFVTIRQVNGGAIDQEGNYLGKAVRWYYARGVEGPLRYKLNNYTVARSEGARPCMQLPEAIPADLDRDWYVREALSILADVGIDPVAYQVKDLV